MPHCVLKKRLTGWRPAPGAVQTRKKPYVRSQSSAYAPSLITWFSSAEAVWK